MAMDLNDAAEQTERKYGPVPSGSSVLVKLETVPASKPHQKNDRIFVTSGGLYMLSCQFTVMAGTYEGVKWRELWMLPVGQQPQNVQITAGQNKACMFSAAKIRAVAEAARGVSPKDNSTAARQKRVLSSVMDLEGMVFPARLGIDDGREYNGRMYFNNTVNFVITPDKAEYGEIMSGGERINPNGKTGNDTAAAPAAQNSFDSYESAIPSEVQNMDDCPF